MFRVTVRSCLRVPPRRPRRQNFKQLETAFPHPFFDEFPFNPFVMTFENPEGNRTLARDFQPATEKKRANIELLGFQRSSRAIRCKRKSLTQRGDSQNRHNAEEAKNNAKARWSK
jgi:hypothetical protein